MKLRLICVKCVNNQITVFYTLFQRIFVFNNRPNECKCDFRNCLFFSTFTSNSNKKHE